MSTEADGQFKEAVTGATKRKRSGGLSKDDQQYILNMLDEYLDHKGVDRKTAYYVCFRLSFCLFIHYTFLFLDDLWNFDV